jgi:hypothetical protein
LPEHISMVPDATVARICLAGSACFGMIAMDSEPSFQPVGVRRLVRDSRITVRR